MLRLNSFCSKAASSKITFSDLHDFDYIIAMDLNNLRWLRSYKGYERVKLLLEYAGVSRSIADPWYTGDFNETYDDIMQGIEAFYDYLVKQSLI